MPAIPSLLNRAPSTRVAQFTPSAMESAVQLERMAVNIGRHAAVTKVNGGGQWI